MKIYYNLIFLLLIVIGCKNNSDVTDQLSAEKTIIIDSKNATVVDFSKIAVVESIILLKTPVDKPLGTINKVLATKDNYIVLDKLTNTINIFNKDGSFLSKIEKKGKGPGEYLSIENISVTNQNIINVVDTQNQSIKKYNFEGDFLKKVKFEGCLDDYIEMGLNKYYSSYCGFENKTDNYYVNIANGENTSGFFPFKELIKFAPQNTKIFLTDNKGTIFCRPHYDDAIYRFNGNQISMAYKIDFGKLSFPKEKMLATKSIKEMQNLLKKENYIGNISNIHITDEWLYFQYKIENINKFKFYIINLKTNKIIHFFGSKPSEEGIFVTPIANDGHFFYGLLDIWNLSDESIDKINAKYNTKLSKDSNVLVKYTYK